MSSAAAEAAELKQQGNKAFAAHDWPTAIDYYTKAIEKHDKDPSFFCNRAQVSAKRIDTVMVWSLVSPPAVADRFSDPRHKSSLKRMALQLPMHRRPLNLTRRT